MQLLHQESRSPLNPLGVKGVGEGGAVAPPAAIANAVCDALAPFRAEFNATPIKPEHIVRAVASGATAASIVLAKASRPAAPQST
jgi:carbon-monoxide dehydrogenase large subunit